MRSRTYDDIRRRYTRIDIRRRRRSIVTIDRIRSLYTRSLYNKRVYTRTVYTRNVINKFILSRYSVAFRHRFDDNTRIE